MTEHAVNLSCDILLVDKARLSIAKTHHSRIAVTDESESWYEIDIMV